MNLLCITKRFLVDFRSLKRKNYIVLLLHKFETLVTKDSFITTAYFLFNDCQLYLKSFNLQSCCLIDKY